MDYRYIRELSDSQYAGLLNRGWRRFGHRFFRPTCPACARCRSLRVKVAEFLPGKTQRRVFAKNRDVRLEVRPASVSDAHLQLYHGYHDFMAGEKGWQTQRISAEEYREHFLGNSFGFSFDFLYFLEKSLVAVGLVDVTANASSSVYFYHEPSLRGRSLGVYSMLRELEYARERQIPHHHLGYWVPECPSMNYKGTYHPRELLVGYPKDYEEPNWAPEENWHPVLNRPTNGSPL